MEEKSSIQLLLAHLTVYVCLCKLYMCISTDISVRVLYNQYHFSGSITTTADQQSKNNISLTMFSVSTHVCVWKGFGGLIMYEFRFSFVWMRVDRASTFQS